MRALATLARIAPAYAFAPLLAATCLATPSVGHAKRIALVVGNDSYTHVSPLQKARNDALAVSKKLEGLGFETLVAIDVDRRMLNARLREFEARIEAGDVAMLFFAGHGVEIEGENYLLPVDIPLTSSGGEALVRDESLPLSETLDRLRRTRAELLIVILDACRDNPFAVEGGRSIGAARGLGRVVAPTGTFVMFSAAAGESALDRMGGADPDPNSVYTRKLISLLDEPGLTLQQIALRIRRQVNELAGTIGHKQTPAYYDEALDGFTFRSGAEGAEPSSALRLQEIANDFLAAKAEGGASALRGFLSRRGDGPGNPFAAIAKAELDTIEAATPAADPNDAPTEHLCDRLAANPADPMRRTDGILWDSLAKTSALRACAEALEQWPDDPQFRYQYARVLHASGDFVRARRIFETLAAEDYAAAINSLGFMSRRGQGVPLDDVAARAHFERAAALGYAPSMNNLGWLYQTGRGVAQDHAEARRWYALAIEKGHAVSMTNLGWMHLAGLGGPPDFAAARSWFVKAAEHGDAVAMTNLGWMDQNGLGAPQDFGSAERWFEEAAARGEPKSMRNLGDMARLGVGREADPEEAASWYLRALRAGDGELLDMFRNAPEALPAEIRASMATVLVAAGFQDGPAADAPPAALAEALLAYTLSYRR